MTGAADPAGAVFIVAIGLDGGASPAVAATIVVSSVSPAVVRTGATSATIDIYGSGFSPDVWVEIRRPNAPLGEHGVGAGGAVVHQSDRCGTPPPCFETGGYAQRLNGPVKALAPTDTNSGYCSSLPTVGSSPSVMPGSTVPWEAGT